MPTGMNPTIRLFGCRGEAPQRLAERNITKCRIRPACAAARGQVIRFSWPTVVSTTWKTGVNEQAFDRNRASEVGKTCSPRNLRAFRPMARLEMGNERCSRWEPQRLQADKPE